MTPADIASSPDGRLWVAERRGRVRVFNLVGANAAASAVDGGAIARTAADRAAIPGLIAAERLRQLTRLKSEWKERP